MRLRPPSPPSSAGTSNGATRRTLKATTAARTDKRALARIFDYGRQRLRETFDHYPSDLVIALNGEIIAVRDISSARSVLKVETRSAATLELIEIFSEQGLLLLLLPIADHPPLAPPELRHEVELSGDRLLTLSVRFTADGALIEATYLDPHFSTDREEEDLAELAWVTDGALDIEAAPGVYTGKIPAGAVEWPEKLSLWRRLLEGARLRRPGPLLYASFAVLVAAVSIWIFMGRQPDKLRADRLVEDATRSESRLRTAFGPGVVHQQVEIRTGGACHPARCVSRSRWPAPSEAAAS